MFFLGYFIKNLQQLLHLSKLESQSFSIYADIDEVLNNQENFTGLYYSQNVIKD